MVRDQLLCIVVPIDTRHAMAVQASLDRPTAAALDHVFTAVRCTHFACVALLPPGPSTPGAVSTPSLLLELAIDPAVSPEDAIARLVDKGFDALWPLYGPCLGADSPANDVSPQERLRRCLSEHTTRADGGYVGNRDRTVAQINAEAALFDAARAEVARARQPLSDSKDLAMLAAGMVKTGDAFAFARTRAPRSFWRAPWMRPWIKVLVLSAVLVVPGLLLLLAALGAFAVVGALVMAAAAVVLDFKTIFGQHGFFGPFFRSSVPAVGSILIALVVLVATAGVASSRVMAVVASVIAASVLGVAFVVLPLGLWDRGLVEFAGAMAVLAAWGLGAAFVLVLIALVAAALFVLALAAVPAYLGWRALLLATGVLLAAATWFAHRGLTALFDVTREVPFAPLDALRNALPIWGLHRAEVLVVSLVAASILGAWLLRGFWRVLPRVQTLTGKLDMVRPSAVEAAQQSAPSVDACEADLRSTANHMISVTDIRGGAGRNRLTLWFFLRLITFLGEAWFTEGTLGTASGIKFGHWHIIDNGRRLLFCSNYDGSFGGYLDEFINGASQGINLFWRWTELNVRGPAVPAQSGQAVQPGVERHRSFPPTRLLIFRGCKQELWFKAFARDSMVPHLYRFEAYPYTNQDVDRATRLRDALADERSEFKNDQIMRALES